MNLRPDIGGNRNSSTYPEKSTSHSVDGPKEKKKHTLLLSAFIGRRPAALWGPDPNRTIRALLLPKNRTPPHDLLYLQENPLKAKRSEKLAL
jgi:hypothetical protein